MVYSPAAGGETGWIALPCDVNAQIRTVQIDDHTDSTVSANARIYRPSKGEAATGMYIRQQKSRPNNITVSYWQRLQ